MNQKISLEALISLLKDSQEAEMLELASAINPREPNYDENDVNKLQQIFKEFTAKDSFQVGQIVKWKENLKNRKLPHLNQPAIVIDVLVEPIMLEEDSGSPYFREHLDLVLGILDEDDILLTFYYDSRRFEPYQKD